ncbi:hypothetical protein HID58_049568 [Brassica napus]|uniref:Uncharacterized protein n=1 Tax=Brassica napus TaxID=3708 RepID=A0ABQ8B5E8_BRANA|nr:hypothetical protein HID58_049568 [Brassica napus]
MADSIPFYLNIVAFLCTVGAIALAIFHIYRHLLNYTEPTYQRYIVRIVFMVPVYAFMSFLSLVLPTSSIYFDSIREVYEAWVIYNFLSLCLAWVGGPGAVVLSLSGRSLQPSWCLMTCCFPPLTLDGRFIRRCKQGCLQFVILKPILVAVTLVLYAKGKYKDGNFNPDQAYLYLTIIYTISYTVALYALVLFYMACRDLLQPFNPVPKFVIIKSVVFLTYWQMLIAAACHFYAFPYREYAGANVGGSRSFSGSLTHAVKLNDFYHDTVHQFAPTYHDYVLYNHHNEGGEEGTKKYRSRTFVPTGQEMDAMRKNKPVYANKIDGVSVSSSLSSNASSPKSSSVTSDPVRSEAVKSSLLVDASDSLDTMYDMTLIDIDISSFPSNVPSANESGPR